jgi:hypothetical protein
LIRNDFYSRKGKADSQQPKSFDVPDVTWFHPLAGLCKVAGFHNWMA